MKLIDNALFEDLCEKADDFAPWAPEEGAPEAAGFVRWMVRVEAGEKPNPPGTRIR